jgi:hypothetical protein
LRVACALEGEFWTSGAYVLASGGRYHRERQNSARRAQAFSMLSRLQA